MLLPPAPIYKLVQTEKGTTKYMGADKKKKTRRSSFLLGKPRYYEMFSSMVISASPRVRFSSSALGHTGPGSAA